MLAARVRLVHESCTSPGVLQYLGEALRVARLAGTS